MCDFTIEIQHWTVPIIVLNAQKNYHTMSQSKLRDFIAIIWKSLELHLFWWKSDFGHLLYNCNKRWTNETILINLSFLKKNWCSISGVWCGYWVNKPLSAAGILEDMPKAEIFSEKTTVDRNMKPWGQLWNFEVNLSAHDIIFQYTSKPEGSLFILEPSQLFFKANARRSFLYI